QTGSVTSQGDVTHRANVARSTYGVTGAGVKVGVLSDSANKNGRATASIASGDIPHLAPAAAPNTKIVADAASGNDEGTAMMEIVSDLAPGASLAFATANGGVAAFADNIKALDTNEHCQVIVDDAFYRAEDPFQDDVVAQAVNTVVAHGVLYFSSAGNQGNTA